MWLDTYGWARRGQGGWLFLGRWQGTPVRDSCERLTNSEATARAAMLVGRRGRMPFSPLTVMAVDVPRKTGVVQSY